MVYFLAMPVDEVQVGRKSWPINGLSLKTGVPKYPTVGNGWANRLSRTPLAAWPCGVSASRWPGGYHSPIIGNISNVSLQKGATLDLQILAHDPDGKPITLTISGLPPGNITLADDFVPTPNRQ